MITKIFECEECQTVGKIQVEAESVLFSDLVYCPVCGSDIFEEDYDDIGEDEDE